MIGNTADYISLMRGRAAGTLPDMGSALRVAALIKEMRDRQPDGGGSADILDVGCGAGHYYRTLVRQGLSFASYVGLEIDPEMVRAAREVWADEIDSGRVEFVNVDIEKFVSKRKFDFVICANAFMYFPSARTALANLLGATRRHLIVRSYFADSSYRVVRAQTRQNHDKSQVDEIDVFDECGNIVSGDYWNIYSYSYIEALVGKLNPRAKLEWIEDKNPPGSMEQERDLGISKRGATQVLEGHEISYPFILPWKYFVISLDAD